MNELYDYMQEHVEAGQMAECINYIQDQYNGELVTIIPDTVEYVNRSTMVYILYRVKKPLQQPHEKCERGEEDEMSACLL